MRVVKQGVVVLLIVVGALLSGCNSTSEVSAPLPERKPDTQFLFNDQAFLKKDTITPEALFYLTTEQKRDFLNFYNDPANAYLAGHRRLYAYLENILGEFSFRGKTLTAHEALQTNSGNCLSLAILTTALASAAGIDVSYQRVNSAPIYHRFKNLTTLSSHVRTRVYDPDYVPPEGIIMISKPFLIIDYFPEQGNVTGKNVGNAEFLAKYYQNVAAEALTRENYNTAYWNLKVAIKLSPDNAETLNSFGVLYRQTGDLERAEKIYVYALEHAQRSANLISNYAYLLEQQSRHEEAKTLLATIEGLDDDNPYRWLDVADYQFAKGNQLIALKYYKLAVEAGPYLHEGYFGLAKTYHFLGLKDKAKTAIESAMALSFVPEENLLYEAKLRMLEGDT